jgi:hypothetical protein
MRHLRAVLAVAVVVLLAPAAARAAGTPSLSFTQPGSGVFVVAASGATAPGQLGIGSTGVFASFSPDGSKVAYVAGGRLMVADQNGAAARRLAGGISVGSGLPPGGPPSWSPNSKTIAWSDGQALWTVSAAGGKARPVLGSTNGFVDGATHPVWSHSGTTLYYLATNQAASVEYSVIGVYRVPVTGGQTPTAVSAGFGSGLVIKPFSLSISPSGRTLAVTLADSAVAATQFATGLVGIGGGTGTVLNGLSAAAFAPSGTQLCAQTDGAIVVTTLSGAVTAMPVTTAGATACTWVTG